jgi:lipid-A-disaccharide synthase
MSAPPRVFVSAGEASGDLHGASLAASLARLCPDAVLEGMGGDRMRQAGVDIRVDIRGLAITGIMEVVVRLPRVLAAFRRLVAHLAATRPDVAVLIDAPEFNMRLAQRAHRLGIPVVYYISPQVWAWRGHRIATLARVVRRMLVILPFEADLYRSAGVDAQFVGHPLLDQPFAPCPREALLADLDLTGCSPVISFLPGSRNNELEHMAPVLARTIGVLSRRFPRLGAIVPLAPTVPVDRARRIFGRLAPAARLVRDRTHDAIAASDLAVAAAGTVTLEAALLGTPLVVLYRTSPLTYFIASRLVQVPHVSLVNLVAQRPVVPELIQSEACPERLAAAAEAILTDPAEASRMRSGLAEVRRLLGQPGASERAARAILSILPGMAPEAPASASGPPAAD